MAIRNVINPGNSVDIRANFLTQLTASSNGDTIVFPAGTFIMSSMTTINKDVTITGAGINQTILYRDEAVSDDTLEDWYAMFYCTSTGITFDGITLLSKTPSIYNDGHDSLSIAIDRGIEFEYGTTGFKVSNCSFENFGHSGIAVFHEDAVADGLITGCQFSHNYKGLDGLGYGYGITVFGRAASWVVDPRLGSNNFIFIENNTFEFHRHSVASAGGSLMVIRYNTFLNNLAGGQHCIDTHSARGPGNGVNSLGSRATEVYNNTIINTKFINGNPLVDGYPISNISTSAVAARAGDLIVFNNTISGYRFGIGLGLWDVTPLGAYPYLSQPGYSSGSLYGAAHTGNVGITRKGKRVASTSSNYGDGDLYYWNNTFTPYIASPSASSQAFYNYDPTDGATHYFVAERDFHNIVKPNYKPYAYPHP